MSKSKKLKTLIGIATFIILSNVFVIFYVTLFEGGFSKKYHFITFDSKYSFTISPYKNTDTKYLEIKYDQFKKYKPEYNEKELFRTFKINPLKYWHWYEYLFAKRYKYQYKEQTVTPVKYYEEIEKQKNYHQSRIQD